MIRLFVVVPDISAILDAGYTQIRVYTDTSSSGSFTTLDGSITLVASQESYEYNDADGTSDTWYKTAYFGSTPGESDKSTAFKGDTATAYATVKEMRAHVGKTLTNSDYEISQILDAATFAIDAFCNRKEDGFEADAEASARTFVGEGTSVCWIDECVEITSVAVKTSANETSYSVWAATDWQAGHGHPTRINTRRTPYTFITILPTGAQSAFTSGKLGSYSVPTVQVTARWGYAERSSRIFNLLRQACLAQAARWHQRIRAGWADTLAGPEFGTQLFRKPLDPDIQFMLVEAGLVRQPEAEGLPL